MSYHDDDYDDDSELVIRDPLHVRLKAMGGKSRNAWLWCLHCERFFQVKHLKVDFLGNRQGCPFPDCGAAGFDVDIYAWDDWAKSEPTWPKSEKALRYGTRSNAAAWLEVLPDAAETRSS